MKGTFSQVKIRTYMGKQCAIKKIIHKDSQKIWEYECRVLQTLSKEARLYSVTILGQESPYIVMDYAGTVIEKIIENKPKTTRKKYKYMMTDLLKGIKYIHESGVIHFDVKTDNVAFDGVRFRYIDFGCSYIKGVYKERNNCTLYCQAPDIENNTWESVKYADYWCIGVCILRWFDMDYTDTFYEDCYTLYNDFAQKYDMGDVENIREEPLFPIYKDLSTDFLSYLISRIEDKEVQTTCRLLLEKDENIRMTNCKTLL